MRIPDFEVFANSIDPEIFRQVMSQGADLQIIEFNALEPGSMQIAMEKIWEQAVKTSYNFCKNYLMLYHQWLQGQLEDLE